MTESHNIGKQYHNGTAGIGIDFAGNPVVDPTANVIALSEAATKRQDDLREMNNDRIYAEIRRVDADVGHLKEMAILRAAHASELAEKESKRLDAVRAIDVQARERDAAMAHASILSLSTQLTTNIETLRNALASTAATIASQTAATVSQITTRIETLERMSYERSGKQAVSDPMLVELVSEMKSLRESRAVGKGKGEGSTALWGFIASGIGLFFSFIAAISIMVHMFK